MVWFAAGPAGARLLGWLGVGVDIGLENIEKLVRKLIRGFGGTSCSKVHARRHRSRIFGLKGWWPEAVRLKSI